MIILLLYVLVFLILVKLYTVFTTFECTAHTCLVGKVAIVTGGNSGIGLETAFQLASRGCKVIILDVVNSEENVAKIKEETKNPHISWIYVDLGSLASVRQCAQEILKSETKLDILINNAGIGAKQGFTKDGLQETMQVNYFGHFLLTHLLIDLLKKSGDARVVGLSSIMAFFHSLSTPESINTKSKSKSSVDFVRVMIPYANAKAVTLIAMQLMAEKMKKTGIKCYSVHTGAAYTPIFPNGIDNWGVNIFFKTFYLLMVRIMIFFLGKSVRRAADTIMECAISKESEALSGKYFWNGKVFWEPPIVNNKKLCLEIWRETERLVKLKDSEKIL